MTGPLNVNSFFSAYIIELLNKLINLDPLDPLTEIIKSGQAFSFLIGLERILWVMIGFFFLGAISTSITRVLKQNDWVNKSFLSNLKAAKREDNTSRRLSDGDN